MTTEAPAKPITVVDRETWLAVAWVTVCKYTGIDPEEPHISVGFPVSPSGGRQRLRSTPAQLVPGHRSKDGIKHIFVSPALPKGQDAIAALLWLIKHSKARTEQDLKDGFYWVPDPPNPSDTGRNEGIAEWLTTIDNTTLSTIRAITKEVVDISGARFEDLHAAITNYQARKSRRSLKRLFCRNCGWIAYATKKNVPFTAHDCPVDPGQAPIGGGGDDNPGEQQDQDVDGDVDLTPPPRSPDGGDGGDGGDGDSDDDSGKGSSESGSDGQSTEDSQSQSSSGSDTEEDNDGDAGDTDSGSGEGGTDTEEGEDEDGSDSSDDDGDGSEEDAGEQEGDAEGEDDGDSQAQGAAPVDSQADGAGGDSQPNKVTDATEGNGAPAATTNLTQMMAKLRAAAPVHPPGQCDDPTCVVCSAL
jgi:hypothetical protein